MTWNARECHIQEILKFFFLYIFIYQKMLTQVFNSLTSSYCDVLFYTGLDFIMYTLTNYLSGHIVYVFFYCIVWYLRLLLLYIVVCAKMTFVSPFTIHGNIFVFFIHMTWRFNVLEIMSVCSNLEVCVLTDRDAHILNINLIVRYCK